MSDYLRDGPPPGWCPECDGPSRCAPGTCCGVGAPEAARELHEALNDLQGLAHRLGFCCYAAALDPNGPCPWHAEAAANDDLIERCAEAAGAVYMQPWQVRTTSAGQQRVWRDVARAVLAEAAAQPPATISAEDVRAAERAWADCPRGWTEDRQTRKAAFVADYLNRRGER